MAVRRIRGVARARLLAEHLNSAARAKPCVVISAPAARSTPYIDADAVFEQVGDLADVFVMPTGEESLAFAEAMPSMTQVYGGAGRVYPPDLTWVVDPYRSPLRFAFDAAEGARSRDRLVADALRMAGEAGLLARGNARPVAAEGEVKTIVPPSRAIVRTTDGMLASVWQELLCPAVDVERLLRPGMRVRGSLDPATRRFDATQMLLPADECLAGYQAGDVVLAEVAETGDDTAVLRLHPEVEVAVGREDVTSNPLDLVSSLMSPGEVLSVRVLTTGPTWRLSLLDVDDSEQPRPAPSVLRGGPEWLVAGPPPVAEPPAGTAPGGPSGLAAPEMLHEAESSLAVPAADGAPSTPPPAPGAARPTPLLLDPKRRADAARSREAAETRADALTRERDAALGALQRSDQQNALLRQSLEAMRAERQLLHDELETAKAESQRLGEQLRRSRADLRKARQAAARGSRADRAHGPLFLDPEQQFRHEVTMAWATRVPAAEKERRPLPAYSVGPEFLRSVESVGGIDRSKIVDVVVEVVTGLADSLPGRDLHHLRSSPNGGARPVVRGDGATCWRTALQVNAPQARRLHFWRLPGGGIELSRVTLHDDFTP